MHQLCWKYDGPLHSFKLFCVYVCIYVTLDHKTSLKSLGYIFNNSQKYIVWVKMIHFLLCQKSLGYYVKIMVHEEILYILFSNMQS